MRQKGKPLECVGVFTALPGSPGSKAARTGESNGLAVSRCICGAMYGSMAGTRRWRNMLHVVASRHLQKLLAEATSKKTVSLVGFFVFLMD